MQVSFNKRTIFPTVYRSEKDGKERAFLSTTVLSPVKYNLTAMPGMMPVEQIQAILEECADNAQEVEIEFTEQQTKFGAQMQVFSVKPLPKKNRMFNSTCSFWVL
ncbi:hypothetical protein [Acinetobacter seifertii]|uniref:hypothetical protein n=1 Tax=Acinetobacter seifertii TaxID=1530123 RepID=UPI000D34FDEC|nr:hypothetical protein [Acinetobacter seifertii]PTV49155.1 hypothetical protein DBL04_18175 [Acinetobacter seifertii]